MFTLLPDPGAVSVFSQLLGAGLNKVWCLGIGCPQRLPTGANAFFVDVWVRLFVGSDFLAGDRRSGRLSCLVQVLNTMEDRQECMPSTPGQQELPGGNID